MSQQPSEDDRPLNPSNPTDPASNDDQNRDRGSESQPEPNYNLFDYLLDTALGRSQDQPGHSATPTNSTNASTTPTVTLDHGPSADATGAASGTEAQTGPQLSEPQSGLSGPALGYHPLGIVGTDLSGSIIITVNYMFLDGTEGDGPGRTGSLVVTLPNTAANREPRAIQLFISLATRMAYLVLVSSTQRKKGIHPDTFQKFPVKSLPGLTEQTCAICFEQYEQLPPPIDDCVTKKRKMNLREPTPTASTSNEREEKATLETCDIEWKHVPVELPCGHIFGQSCLAHWLNENRNCPLCRNNIPDEVGDRNDLPPVTYLRFGGPGAGGMHLYDDRQPSTGEDSAPQPESRLDQSEEQAPNPPQDTQNPGLLRRATSVIFHPHRHVRSTDRAGLPSLGRRRNSPVSPMITQILNLFSRNRRREQERRDSGEAERGASSIFASGVSSRRTADGVETTTTEHGLEDSTESNQGLSRDTPQEEEEEEH